MGRFVSGSAALPIVKAGRARRPAKTPGGWLTVGTNNRDRQGSPLGSQLRVGGQQVQTTQAGMRWLSYSEMWTAYRRVPDLRAAFDQIARRVATWDWGVRPTVDPASDTYQALLDECEAIRRFLAAPNGDGETWQELLTKVVTDLLVFDQGSLELVSNAKKKIKELVALRGSTIAVQRDERGRVIGYTQHPNSDDDAISGLPTGAPVNFKPDELLFLRLFPTTASPQGNPLVETIMDEVVTILRAAEHVMLAYDANEIPPGIVVLCGLTGQAATRAAEDLRTMTGQDHKIRVLTTPDPSAAGAKWVELRHTPKDLAMREIVNDIRRIIWRVCGVTPVEMGSTEGVNRATSEVQLEIGSSHLVNPILELIAAKINARIVPLLLSKPELAAQIEFYFDREAKLSAEERLAEAQRRDVLVKAGIMSRNEARQEEKLPPAGDLGDILTVVGDCKRLEDVLDPPEPPAPAPPFGGGGTDDGGDEEEDDAAEEPEAGDASDEDDAPGEAENAGPAAPETRQECMARLVSERLRADPGLDVEAEVSRAYDECSAPDEDKPERKGAHRHAHQHTESCGCSGKWGDTYALSKTGRLTARLALAFEIEHQFRSGKDLPSDWQPGGRFRGYRTINLPKLGDEISRYTTDARQIWREARATVVAKAAAEFRAAGELTEAGAQRISQALDDATTKLTVDWRTATGPRYTAAAKLGRDAAVDFSGSAQAGEGHDLRAELYFSKAMGWLTDSNGPIEAVKKEIRKAISENVGRLRSRGIEDEAEIAAALAVVERAWDAAEYRIYNWSGRLVELANEELAGTLNRATEVEQQWWAEWVYVGDAVTCSVCTDEGMRGIQPLSSFKTVPGGDTLCGGRCRCVLTVWTKDEVDNGKAVRLGPTQP